MTKRACSKLRPLSVSKEVSCTISTTAPESQKATKAFDDVRPSMIEDCEDAFSVSVLNCLVTYRSDDKTIPRCGPEKKTKFRCTVDVCTVDN